MKKLVTTEEAARVLGVTPRAIQKKFNKGKIEGEFVNSGKGFGEGGQVLKVYIDDDRPLASLRGGAPSGAEPVGDSLPTAEDGDHPPTLNELRRAGKNRYKIHPGEPGCHVVTPLINGVPVLEPQVKAETLSAIISGNKENLPQAVIRLPENVVSEKARKKANLCFALIQKFNEELTRKDPNLPLFKNGNGHRSKTQVIRKYLDLYNSGAWLPDIHKELGSRSKATLYNWLRAFTDHGIEGLTPQYRGAVASQILPGEKDFLLKFLLNQNKPKISDGIRECKRYLGEYSISGPSTLRRFVNEFKTQYHDVWTLRREGEKAWNDKDAPYQDRDPMLLEVGEVIVGDGSKLNLDVIDPITGKEKRGMLVLFWDWKSTYPLGWEIMFSENIQCITAALRNALLTLGKIPSNIYIDNGRAFLAKIFTRKVTIEETEIPGMIARLGSQYRRAMPYHGQSKPIERFFRIINDRLYRRMRNYRGSSIEDKPPYLLRNEKLAQQLHDDRPHTVDEIFQSLLQWREEYVDEPLPKRQGLTARQMFNDGKGAGLDPKALCFLMMGVEIKSVRRCRFTFAGTDFEGPCLYGYKGKVIIRYSLSDFSKIFVFDTNDRYMGIVTQCGKANPIKDWQAAKRIISDRRKYKRGSKQLLAFIEEKRFLVEGRRDPNLIDYIEAEEAKRPENRALMLPHFDEDEPAPAVQASEPHFNDAWERYEFLMKKSELMDEEKSWIKDYETGVIFPGEWMSNYGTKAEAL